jgi:hypothetical protein
MEMEKAAKDYQRNTRQDMYDCGKDHGLRKFGV